MQTKPSHPTLRCRCGSKLPKSTLVTFSILTFNCPPKMECSFVQVLKISRGDIIVCNMAEDNRHVYNFSLPSSFPERNHLHQTTPHHPTHSNQHTTVHSFISFHRDRLLISCISSLVHPSSSPPSPLVHRLVSWITLHTRCIHSKRLHHGSQTNANETRPSYIPRWIESGTSFAARCVVLQQRDTLTFVLVHTYAAPAPSNDLSQPFVWLSRCNDRW